MQEINMGIYLQKANKNWKNSEKNTEKICWWKKKKITTRGNIDLQKSSTNLLFTVLTES